MTDTLQLEDPIQLRDRHDAPKLLVEWTPRWQDFVTSIRPAFARSGARLAGEAPHGIFPYQGMLALLLEAFILFVLIVIPKEIAKLRPYAPPKVRPYEVIYYSGDELPRTEDLGGAQAGATGRAGGHEAHHRTQTIRVARGGSLAPKVVDAPDLKLPSTAGAVANLLAFKATNPGPPPSEGLHSSLVAPSLPINVIAPPPENTTRDQSRTALNLNSVVAPAPSISPDKSRSAPALNAAIVPPAPSVRSEHTLIAPALDPSIIAPAPHAPHDRTRTAPSLNPSVINPASTRVSTDLARPAPAVSATVIPPAPANVGSEVAPTRVQMNNVAVVPPPVSAPERDTGRNAKLNLPAPSVVAPPPSADSAHDLRRLESGSTDPSKAVVPPPPTPTSNGSFVSTVIGKLFGTQDVVPPPPTVSAAGASGTARNGGSGGSVATSVVPPPPTVGSATASKTTGTPGESLAAKVVPPPPSVAGSGNSTSGRTAGLGTSSGTPNVIPPPPSVAGSGATHGSSTGAGTSGGSGNATQLANNVVPPPPSISSGSGLSGSGRKGSGLGGPGDSGSVLAPPRSDARSSDGSGVVVSSQPGSKVGMPGDSKGSLAMSPTGGDKPGLGGSGGGASIGHGDGPGSGLNATGSGAGKNGTGVGSDPNKNVHAGISPTPGPGGAGSAATGSPAVRGVDVRGGSTSVVNLPSFGSDSSTPNSRDRSPAMPNEGPAITIVATSRSGGAFDFYGKLPGDNYSVYVDTSIGTVVMQFAEVNPAASAEPGALTGPRGYVTDLPAGLPHSRVVIKCRLDTSGKLQNLQVLEPGPAAMTAKIMAALPNWKFRPAMRGTRPIEINAILGFNINTNDRN